MMMQSLLATPFAAPGATLDGPFGIAAIVGVAALLIMREAIPRQGDARTGRWRTRLTVALVPLVMILTIALAKQLVAITAPVLALEFASTETAETARQNEATASATSTQTTPPAVVTIVTPAPLETPSTAAPASPPTAGAPTAVVSSPQQIVAAVDALRSGQFETRITYANGTSSTALVRFDLGDGQRPTSLYSQTTFQGATGGRTTERIVIGDRTWTRRAGGAWVSGATAQPVRDEILAFLPNTSAVPGATSADAPNALRWYDATRDADARLETDPITGIPQRMQQNTRGTGTVLTATYRGWNTAVTIIPPTGQ